MSERMMTVDEARETLNILDGRLPLIHASRTARTIVAQAEQINRLQEAVEHALYYSAESTSDLIQQGIILPEDMETPA